MVVSESGDVLGSLSGGCVEAAVVAAALEVTDDGGPRREFFGYSAADAFAVGLTCGGELEVHIELLADASGPLGQNCLNALAANDPGTGLALIRRVDARAPQGARAPQSARPPVGAGAVVIPDPASYQVARSAAVAALLGIEVGSGGRSTLQAAAALLEPLLRSGTTGVVRLAPESGCYGDAAGQLATEPVTLLVESRLPPARMLVFGANVAAEAAAGRINARTVACVLSHDPKFDLPLLESALRLDLAYVGAMGSRRSHAQRTESLLAAGVTPEEVERLHSPIGLDLGAGTPAEVAVSIAAELLAARSPSARGLSLKHGSGPIHQYAGAGLTAPQRLTPQRHAQLHQEMPWT